MAPEAVPCRRADLIVVTATNSTDRTIFGFPEGGILPIDLLFWGIVLKAISYLRRLRSLIQQSTVEKGGHLTLSLEASAFSRFGRSAR